MHRLVKFLSRGAAIVGGTVLLALIVLTALSILGRELSKLGHRLVDVSWMSGLGEALVASGVDEINGTYELTEAGVAFAIFAFLPVCQFLRRSRDGGCFYVWAATRQLKLVAGILGGCSGRNHRFYHTSAIRRHEPISGKR